MAVILFAPSGEVPDQFAAVRRFIRRPDGPLERLQEQKRVAAVHGARRQSDMVVKAERARSRHPVPEAAAAHPALFERLDF